MTSLLATVLTRAQGFFVEPVDRGAATHHGRASALPADLDIAVLGQSPGCGTTTIARALASALSRGADRRAHLISFGADQANTAVVARRANVVAQLAARPAALVWDVEPQRASLLPPSERRAAVLVSAGNSEPALAEVVVEALAERFGRVLVVANRVTDPLRWQGRVTTSVPESRLAAMLVARGWPAPASFAAPIERLARALEASG